MTTPQAHATPAEKRQRFRAGLASGQIQRLPGAFSPLAALAVADCGFEGIYVSGAVLSADLGLPDIGLTTLTEVAERGRAIARVTGLPALIDAGTQEAHVPGMQTRARLYELIRYQDYAAFDADIVNFEIPGVNP